MEPTDNEAKQAGGHEVGYKKPPKKHRFQKGQSGNNLGRPPKARAGAVDVAGILDESIPVTKAGAARKMSGFEVGVRKLVSRAVKDRDVPAALEFLRLCEKYGVIVPTPAPAQHSGVLVTPKTWDRDEWMKMFERHGPPPWPGARSGLCGSE